MPWVGDPQSHPGSPSPLPGGSQLLLLPGGGCAPAVTIRSNLITSRIPWHKWFQIVDTVNVKVFFNHETFQSFLEIILDLLESCKNGAEFLTTLPSPCVPVSILQNSTLLLVFSLSFMTFTFWKSTGRLFHRVSLSSGLSDIFSWLERDWAFLVRIPRAWHCVLLCASYRGRTVSVCPFSGESQSLG